VHFKRKKLSNKSLLSIYRSLVKPRYIEEKMLVLLRQGRISKWFSGIGQEAVAVGTALALNEDEYILPMHRNLGVFTTRNIPLSRLFSQWQGKASGFTKGRDRSFHFGTNEYHIAGMISHLGSMLGVANGITLGSILDGDKKVAAAFSGDGGASEGDFHEALNVAAVWDLPVIFIVENNGYGLSTPSNEQFRCKQFIDKGIGYGMEAHQVDGNNVLEVYHKVKELSQSMRKKARPALLECMTFRMRGHEEASGTKYVPQELFDQWAVKDPIRNFEEFMLKEGLLDQNKIDEIASQIKAEIDAGLETAFAEEDIVFDEAEELKDRFKEYSYSEVISNGSSTEMRLVDAISSGLNQSMERHENSVLMGQDVAEYGGVFKVSEGFLEKFGKGRIRNTPITESSILAAGLGLSIAGFKAIVEMQFSDFVSCGFNQIVNNLAKVHYRWGQNADVVVRMPTGAGVNAGPFHSQSTESWFFHVPGLKIVYPSNPYDAKGLLAESINDPNPVLFFEHKKLYRSISEEVPEAYYTEELGKAKIVREGDDMCVITYGWGVQKAQEVVEEMGLNCAIVDLRTLLPWDKETVEGVVNRTNKVLILHEDTLTGGVGAEIAAHITEHCFKSLDAPVMRLGSMDTAVPFAANLEEGFLAWRNLKEKLTSLRNF
jgi:2-oxoisovalerate dehydrogenase E1 component